GLGEGGELAQAGLGLLGVAGGVEAGEDDALQAQLPVLDLGDVLELGGQAGHSAQRLPVGEIVLLAVGLGAVGVRGQRGVAAGEVRGAAVRGGGAGAAGGGGRGGGGGGGGGPPPARGGGGGAPAPAGVARAAAGGGGGGGGVGGGPVGPPRGGGGGGSPPPP